MQYKIVHPLIGNAVFASAQDARAEAARMAIVEAEEFYTPRIHYRACENLSEMLDCMEEV